MNGLYQFVLIVSLIFVVEVKPQGFTGLGQIKFPDGFFCKLICQQWHILNGNTVTCFISDNGEYHRFVGRNPAYGVWRFYKVDPTAELSSLCQVSVSGDKFFMNNTESMCPMPEPTTTTPLPHVDIITEGIIEENDEIELEDDLLVPVEPEVEENSSQELNPSDTKRVFLRDLIKKINEEIAKMFNKKLPTDQPPTEEPAVEVAPAEAEARFALHRKLTRSLSKEMPQMDDICQLSMVDVCQEKKIMRCETNGFCCWQQVNSNVCTPDNMETYNECYKGLNALLKGPVMK